MTTTGDTREPHHGTQEFADDSIDLRDLFFRILRGLPQILAFALLGIALAGAGYLIYSPLESTTTSTRVVFSFPGFEKGQYPDKSKFQPGDLRSPDVVAEALKRRTLDTSSDFQSKIRSALNIEGIIPPNIIKERDRLRASGQTPALYIPDEYTVTLTLPRKFSLDKMQRSQLLNEIVAVYHEHFRKTYADTPLAFGNAFSILKNADYPDFQTVFDREMRSISTYLTDKVEEAKLFRSQSTNFTFSDLLKQAQLFSQLRLNETIGLIIQNGLTRNRRITLVKMNDEMRLLKDAEQRALDEEAVVKNLLAQAQNRDQNYVLGVKNQATRGQATAPILDQGVIDSLLANDSYSFLVRKALEAGLKVKQVQADRNQLEQRIENMKAFSKVSVGDQSTLENEVQQSISALETAYVELVNNIKKTHLDYSQRTYGDAIRISAAIQNTSMIRPLIVPIVVGGFLGFALGAGLSLLGIYIGRKSQPATATT